MNYILFSQNILIILGKANIFLCFILRYNQDLINIKNEYSNMKNNSKANFFFNGIYEPQNLFEIGMHNAK